MATTIAAIAVLLIVSLEICQVTSRIIRPIDPQYCSEQKPCPNCGTCFFIKKFCLGFSSCGGCQRCNNVTNQCKTDPAIQCGKPIDKCTYAKCAEGYRCNPLTGGCLKIRCSLAPPTLPTNKCDTIRCEKCKECNRVTGVCETFICGVRQTLNMENCNCENDQLPAENKCMTVKCSKCHECDPFTGHCLKIKCHKCYFCDQNGLSGSCEPDLSGNCVGPK